MAACLVDTMIEEPKNAVEQLMSDSNFLLILAGGIIWFMGYYVGLFAPLFLSTGFVLVCFSAALTSLSRPVAQAWPGLLLGGLIQIIGYYILLLVPLFGSTLSPLFIVPGGVMIIYFAIPLAIQRGELPALTHLQKLIESKRKEEVVDVDAEDVDEEVIDETADEDDLASNE